MKRKQEPRTDPICDMLEIPGTGMDRYGRWFCSESCMKEFEGTLVGKKAVKARLQ